MRFYKKLSFLLLAAASVVSCSEYDDSDLWNEVNGIKDRVTNIESQLSDMNSGIRQLQTLIDAIKDNVYVVSFTKVTDGYEIVLSDGRRFTIHDGKDGKDGADGKDGQDGKDGKDGTTPVVGVAMVGGVYYWTVTINGKTDYLRDANGNMVAASPVNGGSGGGGGVAFTPIIKVDYEGYWVISYDSGVTYTYILDEYGNKVKATGGGSGSCIFREVYQDGDYVVFVLANGTVIRIKSCKCDTTIEDVVPPEILSQMEPYMNIYYGKNPPIVEGTYFIDPFVTVYCQDYGNGGYATGDIVNSTYIGFLNQDNTRLTLDYKSASSKGTSHEIGEGSFIAGNDGNFTVYFNTIGETDGISTKTALVISGTKVSGGIKNLEYAFVMVEKGPDPNDRLMKEGVFRVFKDKDGLAANSSYTFQFAPARAPSKTLSLWYDFIRTI